MARAENQVRIPRPVDAVWATLVDVTAMPRWLPAVRRVEPVDGPAGEPGARYAATVDVDGREYGGMLRIAEVDAPRLLRVEIAAAPLRIDARIELRADGDATLVVVALDAPTPGLLALAAGRIRQALEGALAELPRLADAVG
jgi:carbon monoxide dehydrogenase subunit G